MFLYFLQLSSGVATMNHLFLSFYSSVASSTTTFVHSSSSSNINKQSKPLCLIDLTVSKSATSSSDTCFYHSSTDFKPDITAVLTTIWQPAFLCSHSYISSKLLLSICHTSYLTLAPILPPFLPSSHLSIVHCYWWLTTESWTYQTLMPSWWWNLSFLHESLSFTHKYSILLSLLFSQVRTSIFFSFLPYRTLSTEPSATCLSLK